MSKKEEKNYSGMYSIGDYPKAEIDRLQEFGYPNERTMFYLDDIELTDSTFLDVGAGPSPILAGYVRSKGGEYIGLDLNIEALAQLKKTIPDLEVVQGDSLNLPFEESSIDHLFQRFVLIHLPPEKQLLSIKELIRVARHSATIVEFDWTTLSSTVHTDSIDRFRTLSYAMMERIHADPLAAANLERRIREVLPEGAVLINRFERPEGDYTQEIVMLCRSSAQVARMHPALQDEKMAQEFESLVNFFENNSITFTPPDLVFARVEKNKWKNIVS